MDPNVALALLGGLSPEKFMRRHWQKKPLLVRQALAQPAVPSRGELFALAAREEVESRLVMRSGSRWQMRQGPLARRSLPPLRDPWTLLVQGLDLHHEAMHQLLQRFRFVPDARLDDLMISFATDGGGVGAHFDSYDVFLLQARGRRRWRIGRQRDLALRADAPLKILARFEPQQEFVLDAGDMLYLPPNWAHDGVAIGECMTCSIGFRAPTRTELAQRLLDRLAEEGYGEAATALYRDPGQPAVADPARVPEALREFALRSVAKLLDPAALQRVLGEYLTEPPQRVGFEAGRRPARLRAVALDRRTRMMYDERHVFVNGEAYRASGADAALMRRLAQRRRLDSDELARASVAARSMLNEWCEAGWMHPAKGESR